MRDKETTIIKYMIENKTEELNILKISKALKMDYKTAYSIVKRLEKEQLINIETFGQSSRIKLINKIHPIIFKAEHERREDTLKDKNLRVMLDSFKKALKSKLYILLLFGSYAKKAHGKNSDIDLMFIVPNNKEEGFEKEVNNISRTLPLKLHCLVFSEKQFNEMLNSREPNVGQEALKINIILYGIEYYYEMI